MDHSPSSQTYKHFRGGGLGLPVALPSVLLGNLSNHSTSEVECMARQPLLANKRTLSLSHSFSSEKSKKDLGRKAGLCLGLKEKRDY